MCRNLKIPILTIIFISFEQGTMMAFINVSELHTNYDDFNQLKEVLDSNLKCYGLQTSFSGLLKQQYKRSLQLTNINQNLCHFPPLYYNLSFLHKSQQNCPHLEVVQYTSQQHVFEQIKYDIKRCWNFNRFQILSL